MNSNHYCSNPAKMMIILVVLVSNALLAESTSDKNIMEVLDQNKARFSTLIGAIKMTGLEATLLGDGPFTIFAPTNDAFRKLPDDVRNRFMHSPADLKTLLLGHVVPGNQPARMLTNNLVLTTVAGSTRKITVSGQNVMIGNANVSEPDMMAKNGVIHVIDTVLMS